MEEKIILVVDASVVVAEALRKSGRQRLRQPGLELYLSEEGHSEIYHELPKRLSLLALHRNLHQSEVKALSENVFSIIKEMTVITNSVYEPFEREAKARLRDTNDWHVLALALTLKCGIWTHDQDFFGVGVATWNTNNVARVLQQLK